MKVEQVKYSDLDKLKYFTDKAIQDQKQQELLGNKIIAFQLRVAVKCSHIFDSVLGGRKGSFFSVGTLVAIFTERMTRLAIKCPERARTYQIELSKLHDLMIDRQLVNTDQVFLINTKITEEVIINE
jgi:hypothetical protein